MPGRESFDPDTDSRSRLYVPGDDGARSGPLGGGGLEGERSIQNFRPPQGFMDRDPDAAEVACYWVDGVVGEHDWELGDWEGCFLCLPLDAACRIAC